ncbi:PAP2/haloperoxidase-like protein [Gracilaria domingensis]|nr:PAP2/haloperoxidase-like protein [Gracilaria domingensis]
MDRSLDVTTPVGMGNMMGYRAAEYFSRDGFNSLGDMTRKLNKQRFSDPTGYEPANIAGTDPSELPKPLRWQPLIQEDDGRGRFVSQVHITPHIGLTANPAALTREEVEARVHAGPYQNPDMENTLSEEDEATMRLLLDDFFSVSRNLTQQQIISARFWDNKFSSLALVQVYTGLAWQLSDFEVARVGLGDIIAQYDAIIVAWKEKRMHDLTRPTTMIRRNRAW